MIKEHIQSLLEAALKKLQNENLLAEQTLDIQIDATKDKKFGDYATNIALILSKQAQLKPRELAEKIIKNLPESEHIVKTEIAGPGFINFFVAPAALHQIITKILTKKEKFGHQDLGKKQKIIVEFVSSNPTGPLHVGHGRHGAVGAVVSNLLETLGYDVYREYYVNDAGRQMDILAVSVWLRYLALFGEKFPFPSNAYKGDYVIEIAKSLQAKQGNHWCTAASNVFNKLPKDEMDGGDKEIYIDAVIAKAKDLLGENYDKILNLSLEWILSDIKQDLEEFGVTFNNWFSEREFVSTKAVYHTIQKLRDGNHLYQREGALWFRSTDFEDEKDRVLERSNGQRTYFCNDLAYHVNKFERGFDAAIDIFGSDHHGYVPRMKAGLLASGIPGQKLTYILLQFVTLYRGGQQAQMSTRSGSFVTLRELRQEVGNDAARFFYVMRKCEQHIDFDLDLAKTQSNENPVYYIQYAHARICSVFRQLRDKDLGYEESIGNQNLNLLNQKEEIDLITCLAKYEEIIVKAATSHEPHFITNYLRDLANYLHVYYNAHQFLVDDIALRSARLNLIASTRQVLVNGLSLLGVSAPEAM